MKIDTLRMHTTGLYKEKTGVFAPDKRERGLYAIETRYYNDDLVNIDYKKIYDKSGVLVKQTPLHINISIPKILDGENNIDYTITKGLSKRIDKRVREILDDKVEVEYAGLITDRIDIYKNIEYKPLELITMLDNIRYNGRYNKMIYEDKEYRNITYKNKSRELGLYDKVKEVKSKGGSITGGDITRVELRLKKTRVIKNVFKDRLKYGDVLELVECPEKLKTVYNMGVEYILNGLTEKDKRAELRAVKTVNDVKMLTIVLYAPEKAYTDTLKELYYAGDISKATYYRELREYMEAKSKEWEKLTIKQLREMILYE